MKKNRVVQRIGTITQEARKILSEQIAHKSNAEDLLLRNLTLSITKNICAYCTNIIESNNIDYIIRLSGGGSDDILNRIPCCSKCKTEKSYIENNTWFDTLIFSRPTIWNNDKKLLWMNWINNNIKYLHIPQDMEYNYKYRKIRDIVKTSND